MIEIHRMYRAGFGEGPTLIAGVADGDSAHADVVGDHLSMLSVSLHAHHEFEDENLWDTLDRRAPACVLHVERMKEQHAEMLVHLPDQEEHIVVRGEQGGPEGVPLNHGARPAAP